MVLLAQLHLDLLQACHSSYVPFPEQRLSIMLNRARLFCTCDLHPPFGRRDANTLTQDVIDPRQRAMIDMIYFGLLSLWPYPN